MFAIRLMIATALTRNLREITILLRKLAEKQSRERAPTRSPSHLYNILSPAAIHDKRLRAHPARPDQRAVTPGATSQLGLSGSRRCDTDHAHVARDRRRIAASRANASVASYSMFSISASRSLSDRALAKLREKYSFESTRKTCANT